VSCTCQPTCALHMLFITNPSLQHPRQRQPSCLPLPVSHTLSYSILSILLAPVLYTLLYLVTVLYQVRVSSCALEMTQVPLPSCPHPLRLHLSLPHKPSLLPHQRTSARARVYNPTDTQKRSRSTNAMRRSEAVTGWQHPVRRRVQAPMQRPTMRPTTRASWARCA
jgi:hypothetical protein